MDRQKCHKNHYKYINGARYMPLLTVQTELSLKFEKLMKIWYSSGFSEFNCKVVIGVWGNNFTPFFFTNGPLKSVHFDKTVVQSSFLSKVLSFSLTLFWFQQKWQHKKWGLRNCLLKMNELSMKLECSTCKWIV